MCACISTSVVTAHREKERSRGPTQGFAPTRGADRVCQALLRASLPSLRGAMGKSQSREVQAAADSVNDAVEQETEDVVDKLTEVRDNLTNAALLGKKQDIDALALLLARAGSARRISRGLCCL